MNLIDETYFTSVGGVVIAQLGQLPVREKLLNYISKYEPKLLSELLGLPMFNLYYAWYQAPDTTQRWVDLTEGVDYTSVDGELKHWSGLGDVTESAIANFVYYWFVRSEATYLSGSGAVVSVNENSNRVSPFSLQAAAWAEMVRMNHDLYDYLKANAATYPEWPLNKYEFVKRHCYRDSYYLHPSLYFDNYHKRHRQLRSLFTIINPIGI